MAVRQTVHLRKTMPTEGRTSRRESGVGLKSCEQSVSEENEVVRSGSR
ncbi:MAG: hypothetical protein U1D96_03380 [Eubacteriales bacterium]|nr:hypothetical protein [Eubacteriales bacterium]